MKVHILFNEYSLGFLEEVKEGYLWMPNTKAIEAMKQEHELVMEMFFLPAQPVLFDEIPKHYDEFLEASERVDLKEKVGILDSDSDFVKLYKMGFLEYFSEDFVIRSEN